MKSFARGLTFFQGSSTKDTTLQGWQWLVDRYTYTIRKGKMGRQSLSVWEFVGPSCTAHQLIVHMGKLGVCDAVQPYSAVECSPVERRTVSAEQYSREQKRVEHHIGVQ